MYVGKPYVQKRMGTDTVRPAAPSPGTSGPLLSPLTEMVGAFLVF